MAVEMHGTYDGYPAARSTPQRKAPPIDMVSLMGNHIEDSQTESEEYVSLLEQLGIKDRDLSVHKHRIHRRFVFDSPEKTILVQISNDMCSLFDVSVGGLSFFSKNEYEVGKKLELNFDGKHHVEVVIVNALLEEVASNEEEIRIRHGAEFVHKGDGYKCTLAVLKYFLEIEKAKF